MREKHLLASIILLILLKLTAAQDSKVCANDGYSRAGGCTCNPFTSGPNCATLTCQNDGNLRANNKMYKGCYCPVGFVNQNCEAAQCTVGASNIFHKSTEKVLAAYISYNLEFKKKTIADDPVQAMCSTFANGDYNYLIFYFKAMQSIRVDKKNTDCPGTFMDYVETYCENEDTSDLEDCPGSNTTDTITIAQIVSLLPTKSRLYIFSNLQPSYTEDSYNTAARLAISKRIVINAIFFAPRGILMPATQYNTLINYQYIRNLAEGTTGNYITPYSGTSNNLLGTSKATDAFNFLEQMVSDDFAPVDLVIGSEIIAPIVNVGFDPYYIIFRKTNLGANYSDIFRNRPDNVKTVLDTGFWFIMSAQNNQNTGVITNFLTKGKDPSKFYIFSKNRLETYAAVTTAKEIDASSPYATIGSVRTLVANVQRSSGSLSARFVEYPILISNSSTRNNCLFSNVLGDMQCGSVGMISLRVSDNTSTSSIIPFMCAGNEIDNPQLLIAFNSFDEGEEEREEEEEEEEDYKLYNILGASIQELNPFMSGRTIAILLNSEKNLIQQSLIQPNNVLQYLTNYIAMNGEFEEYYYNIFSSSTSYTKKCNNIADYLTSLMKDAHTSPNDDSANVLGPLNDLFKLYMVQDFSQFSDVILFVSRPQTVTDATDVTDDQIIALANSLRSRLFIVAYEDSGIDFTADYAMYKKLAYRTGGAFINTADPSDFQLKFLSHYFDHVIASSIVDQLLIPTMNAAPYSRTLYMENNTEMSIVIQTPLNTQVLRVTFNDQSLDLQRSNNYWFATGFSSTTDGSQSLIIQAIPTTHQMSFTVYTKSDSILITNAFTDSMEQEFVSGKLSYACTEPQYPIVSIKQRSDKSEIDNAVKVVKMTIYDSNLTMINTVTNLTSRSTDSYKSFWNYAFVCINANDVYYFQTDVVINEIITRRTFQALICAESSNKCLNGGKLTGKTCDCVVGFAGANCEKRICLNNGTLNINGQCDCNGFIGDFCELNSNACTQNRKNEMIGADIRTTVRTVIFVVDPTAIKNINNADFNNLLTGKQLIIASCKNKSESIVWEQTTNGADLNDIFTTIYDETDAADPECLMQSLILAMNTQTSKRAVAFIFADNADWTITQDTLRKLQNEISAGRYDLRIKTKQTNWSNNLKYIASLGNGIPFGGDIEPIDYINRYVNSIFDYSKISVNGFPPSLTVIQSSVETTTPIIYYLNGNANVDATLRNLIIHATNAIVAVTEGTTTTVASSTKQLGTEPNTITTYQFNAKKPLTIKINPKDDKLPFSYSIELLTVLNSAYGFQTVKDNMANPINEEYINVGAHKSNGIVNFYLSNRNLLDSENVFSLPYVLISRINQATGADEWLAQLPVAVRSNASCSYQYYTDLTIGIDDFCKNNETYRMTIISKNSLQLQTQQTVACYAPTSDEDCNKGVINGNECQCDSKWYGTDCSNPVCENGLYSSKFVCQCSKNTTGSSCDATFQTKQTIIFIIDLTGYLDNLYNIQINAIKQLASSLNLNDASISIIGNDYTLSKKQNKMNANVGTADNFGKYLDQFEGQRTRTDLYQDISGTLTELGGVSNDATSANVFLFTQRTYTISAILEYNKLKNRGFKFTYYGLGTIYNPFNVVNDNLGDMNSTGTIQIVNTVDSIYSSMMDILQIKKGDNPPTTQSPIPQPSCVNSVSASIFLQIDISNVADNTTRNTLTELVEIIRDDLNTRPNVQSGCDTNTTSIYWKNKASLITVLYFDQYYSNPSYISFCEHDDSQIARAIATKSKYATPLYDRVFRSAARYQSDNGARCICSRSEQPNVKLISIWMPLTDSNITTTYTLTDFYHLVLPYNADLTKDSVFRTMIETSIAAKGDTNQHHDVNDYIMKPWDNTLTAKDLQTRIYQKIEELFATDCVK